MSCGPVLIHRYKADGREAFLQRKTTVSTVLANAQKTQYAYIQVARPLAAAEFGGQGG